MKYEVEFEWNSSKEKNRKKIGHLVEKYAPKHVIDSAEIRNVKFSDRDLEEVVNEQHVEAVLYGDIEASDDVKEALKMEPKFMLWKKIDEKSIEAEIEKGCMKARYSWMNKKDSEQDALIDETVEIVQNDKEVEVFSLSEKKADCS